MKKTITLKCLNCGNFFEKELAEYKRQMKKGNHNFFCNNSCSAKYNNQKLKKQDIEKICPVCQKKFITKTGVKQKTFCCRSCASKGSVNEKRRQAGKQATKNNFSPETYSIERVQNLLRHRENWKYKKIQEYLDNLDILYEFEYIIENYIYDLALIDEKVIIEFDGKEHNINYDRPKEEIAKNIIGKL